MSIKQAIEALEVAQDALDISQSLQESAKSNHHPKTLAAYERVSAALAALRSMPAEPYAYAVYFPDQPTEELVHDLDELLDDMTNREHTITELFSTQPPAEAVRMSEAEILALWSGSEVATRPVLGSKKVIAFARAVEQATAARLGVKMGDV